jgi:hypothetical protein
MAYRNGRRPKMKRDMEIVREIFVEVQSWGPSDHRYVEIKGRDKALVDWHVALMIEAKLLDGRTLRSSMGDGGITNAVRGITWPGSDLADVILDDGVWGRLKATYADKLSTMPLSVISSVGAGLLTDLAKKAIGLG